MTYDAKRTEGHDRRLVLTFHGTGGSADQFHGAAEHFFPDAHIVSPSGDVIENGARRFFVRRAEGVYHMEDLATRRDAMAAFVTAEKARTGASEVVGIGYSNGANILAAISFVAPRLFDTLALMHPLIPWHPEPEPGLAMTRVLITAGQRDPICPPELTQALSDWYAAQKADVTLAWHPGGHEIPESEVAALASFLT